MRPLHRKSTPSPWPYWLLLLAWVCANSPQSASYAAIAWLGEARSFSHQQRLSADVARLLTGEELPPAEIAHAEKPLAEKPAVPAMPAVTKIELATESSVHSLIPDLPVSLLAQRVRLLESALRAPPPHGPPRVAVVS